MLEVVSSPLYDHGRQPELELAEPGTEALFERQLTNRRPDVVHVQELAGLPSSLLDIAREQGVAVVMTLQDYFALCPAFKLLDAEGQVCLRRDVGLDCAATVRADRRPSNLLFEGSMRHTLVRRAFLGHVIPHRREALVTRIARSRLTRPPRNRVDEPAPAAFQRRREVNLQRLNRADRLLAMSHRVAEIYVELGVDPDRISVMHLTLAHIADLRPRDPDGHHPIIFATLGGGEGVAKGSRLLGQAIRILQPEFAAGRLRLLIFGQCDAQLAQIAGEVNGVELRGTFGPSQLGRLLDEVDVGIIPSIWEEAYGYVGLEFIAKGIPVLANHIGGIVDYVRDRETGWFNRSNSGRGLAEIMRGLAAQPQQIVHVSRSTRAARTELIMSISEHAEEVERTYRDLLSKAPRHARPHRA